MVSVKSSRPAAAAGKRKVDHDDDVASAGAGRSGGSKKDGRKGKKRDRGHDGEGREKGGGKSKKRKETG